MVFYGGFSKGCITCLKRRVKCDEGKPTCHRCAKSKRECLGYRDEQALAFRDEGKAAAGNAPRWRNKFRNHLPGDDRSHTIRRFTDAVLDSSIHSDAALCGLPTVAIVHALRAQPGSSLANAKDALNTAMMAARDHRNKCLRESAHLRYGKAIASLAQDTKAQYTSNDILICIQLLVLAGSTMESGARLGWWAMHSMATGAIARSRGRSMGHDKQSIQLLLCIRMQMILRYSTRPDNFRDIIDDDHPELLSWSDIPEEFTINPACVLQRLLTPLPGMRWDYEQWMDQPYDSSDIMQGLDIIERCRRVDQTLQHWLEMLPPDWQPIYVDHKPTSMPEDKDFNTIMAWAAGEKVTVYRDQWVLFHHSTCMIYRYFLQAFILGAGARLLGCTVQDIANDNIDRSEPLYSNLVQAKEAILGLLDRSCRSVYHHLGLSPIQLATTSVKSPLDLRPPVFAPIILMKVLWQANSVIIGDENHKAMVKASLRFLGQHFGAGFCLHLGNSDDWCMTPLFSSDPLNYAAQKPSSAAASSLVESMSQIHMAK